MVSNDLQCLFFSGSVSNRPASCWPGSADASVCATSCVCGFRRGPCPSREGRSCRSTIWCGACADVHRPTAKSSGGTNCRRRRSVHVPTANCYALWFRLRRASATIRSIFGHWTKPTALRSLPARRSMWRRNEKDSENNQKTVNTQRGCSLFSMSHN